MKKYIFTLLAIFLMIPAVVFADDPKVLTLETDINGNDITFSGTIESGSHAVMCKLYDNEDHEQDMLSVAVDNGAFSGAFTVTATGDYRVACANYEGGAVRSDTTSVDEVVATTYTVTFVMNGGDPIQGLTVEPGTVISPPENTHRDGYRFVEWCEDDTLNIRFDFSTPITNNTVLYAKWEEETQEPEETYVIHTIYLGEGGEYVVDFYTIDGENQGPIGAPIARSSMYTIPSGSPVLLGAIPSEGYRFVGWYRVHEEDADGHGTMEWRMDERITEEDEYTFTPNESMYIAPVFEDTRVFTVTFNTNSDDVIEPARVHYDELVDMPRRPEREGFSFLYWCEDATLNIEFDFNTPIRNNTELYAKWEEDVETVPYDVPDGNGNSISFEAEEGHDFSFAILDLAQISDKELLELTGGEVSREDFDAALDVLKDAVSDEGTFVAIYEIIVVDENDDEKNRGPFTIKIAKTPEMEKFNSFKMLYVDTDNNFEVLETIELDDKGDYLEGTLEHLSSYVLVGNTVATNNNPQTLDNIYVWIITLIISIVGLTTGIITVRKNQKAK